MVRANAEISNQYSNSDYHVTAKQAASSAPSEPDASRALTTMSLPVINVDVKYDEEKGMCSYDVQEN